MAVDIKIDLKTGAAHGKITALKTHMETLEDLGDDFDFDFDLDNTSKQIQDMVSALEEADQAMSNLDTDIQGAAEALDGAEVVHTVETPDGQTGAVGGEADPPDGDRFASGGMGAPSTPVDGGTGEGSGGMSPRDFTRRMDDLFGTRQGTFMSDRDLSDGVFNFGQGVPTGTQFVQDPETGQMKGRRTTFEMPREANLREAAARTRAALQRTGMDEVDQLKDPRRIAIETDFGVESLNMARERAQKLTEEELADIGDFQTEFNVDAEPTLDRETKRRLQHKLTRLFDSDSGIIAGGDRDLETRVGIETDFGTESVSMARRRVQELTAEELEEIGDFQTEFNVDAEPSLSGEERARLRENLTRLFGTDSGIIAGGDRDLETRVGIETDFGTESVSIARKRIQELTAEELEEIGDFQTEFNVDAEPTLDRETKRRLQQKLTSLFGSDSGIIAGGDRDLVTRVGIDTDFGTESVSIARKRIQELTAEELDDIGGFQSEFNVDAEPSLSGEERARLREQLTRLFGTDSGIIAGGDRDLETRVGIDTDFGTESASMARKRAQELTDDEFADVRAPMDMPDLFGGRNDLEFDFDSFDNFGEKFSNLNPRLSKANQGLGRFGGLLKRLKPSMRKWWSLLALIIPLIITFAVQALGVAAALGAVATAGAAVIGLGLVGHAEDMGSAFQQAKQQLSDLKDDLFEVFQPAMRQFAPIQAELFDMAPGELEKISEAMEGLTAYEDIIFSAFSGLVDWVARAVDGMVNAEQVVSQLASRFGAILGTSILDFFAFLLNEARQNQDMLIKLGDALVQIGSIIYELSKVFTRLVVVFKPVLGLLNAFAKALNNPVLGGLLAVLTLFGALAFTAIKVMVALSKLQLAMQIMGYSGLGAIATMARGAIGWFSAMIAKAYATIAAMNTLKAALVTTGIGALVVGAGYVAQAAYSAGQPNGPPGGASPTGGRPGPRGGQTVVNNYNSYTVKHEGEMDTGSEQRLRSTVRSMERKDGAMGTPSESYASPSTAGDD